MELTAQDTDRFWSRVTKTDTCWIWTGTRLPLGYGRFGLKGKILYAHRVSAHLAGMQIDGLLVCHSCDNPSCVNPDHLFTGTHQDNTDDMMLKKRNVPVQGEQHHWHKLRCIDVLQIRRSDLTQTELASKYSVSQATISRIKNRILWPQLK